MFSASPTFGTSILTLGLQTVVVIPREVGAPRSEIVAKALVTKYSSVADLSQFVARIMDVESLMAPFAELAAPVHAKWQSINPTYRMLIMFLITRIISAWIKRRFGPKPVPAKKGAVIETKDSAEFDAAIAEAKAAKAIVVVDFTASWCGPCKRIAPHFAKMSLKYGDVRFLKVDVDKAKDVSAKAGVRCMPTFMIFKDGEKQGDSIEGADLKGIEARIIALGAVERAIPDPDEAAASEVSPEEKKDN
jgi:thioredoxin 1